MIRQLARLALDALIVEGRRWLHPEPAGVPAPAPPAEPFSMPTKGLCCFCARHPRAPGEKYMCASCRDERRARVMPPSSEGQGGR